MIFECVCLLVTEMVDKSVEADRLCVCLLHRVLSHHTEHRMKVAAWYMLHETLLSKNAFSIFSDSALYFWILLYLIII
jgi:hypothetical protein